MFVEKIIISDKRYNPARGAFKENPALCFFFFGTFSRFVANLLSKSIYYTKLWIRICIYRCKRDSQKFQKKMIGVLLLPLLKACENVKTCALLSSRQILR